MNTLQNRNRIYNFSLTVSSVSAMLSAVRDDYGCLLPALRLIELAVCNFRRKSSKAFLFNFCYDIPG